MVVGCWLVVAVCCCLLFGIRSSLFVVSCSLFVVWCLLSGVWWLCLLFVVRFFVCFFCVCWLLRNGCCVLFVVRCVLFAVGCLLFIGRCVMFVVCCVLVAV